MVECMADYFSRNVMGVHSLVLLETSGLLYISKKVKERPHHALAFSLKMDSLWGNIFTLTEGQTKRDY